MPDNFFDTSALGKHYHAELGTAKVDALLAAPGSRHFVSRLTAVEIHSVFAMKVRTGQLALADFHLTIRLFRADVAAKRLEVVRVAVSHFKAAEQLIRRLAPTQNLRTLDALQLAIALGLNDPARPVQFVCADHALCAIVTAEELAVVNPEVP
jgi:predicted nucleic acid-binding protein